MGNRDQTFLWCGWGLAAAFWAICIAGSAFAEPAAPAVVFERETVSYGEKEIGYAALLSDWTLFSKALREKAAAGALSILCGEKFPFPVSEWDGATGKYVWRPPSGPLSLAALWRDFARGHLDWKTGVLQKKSCKKGSCALAVVFEGGEGKSNTYAITVSDSGGRISVEGLECAGPIGATLKLFEKGEVRWAAYAKVLALPEDSAPLSEYRVVDACYRASDAGRQPSVAVKLGSQSGRIDTIAISQGPWPMVTARFGAKKIEEIARTRISSE